MGSDDKAFVDWLTQFVPDSQNMKLFNLDYSKPTIQFKKQQWEENIQSSLLFDLEPSLIDSTKKIPIEKSQIEPEITKEVEEEVNVTPEIQEIVC
jgi:hypothetical protein